MGFFQQVGDSIACCQKLWPPYEDLDEPSPPTNANPGIAPDCLEVG
jgi:hypothetical protein